MKDILFLSARLILVGGLSYHVVQQRTEIAGLMGELTAARQQIAELSKPSPKAAAANWIQQRVSQRVEPLNSPSYSRYPSLRAADGSPFSANYNPSTSTSTSTSGSSSSSKVYFRDSYGRFWLDVSGAKHYE